LHERCALNLGHPGIREQHIDSTMPGSNLCEQPIEISETRHIALHGRRAVVN
jgi:hypothetical protein